MNNEATLILLTREQVKQIVQAAQEKQARPDFSRADLRMLDLSQLNLRGQTCLAPI